MAVLRMGFISADGGTRIPIRIGRWEDRTFLECDHSEEILKHLGYSSSDCSSSDSSGLSFGNVAGTYLRGVLIPGEGGFLQLFDLFGPTHHQALWISENIVEKRLRHSVIWDATKN